MKWFDALFFIILNIYQHVYYGVGRKFGMAMSPRLKSGWAMPPPSAAPAVYLSLPLFLMLLLFLFPLLFFFTLNSSSCQRSLYLRALGHSSSWALFFSLFFIRKFHIELCHSRPTTYLQHLKKNAIFILWYPLTVETLWLTKPKRIFTLFVIS